MTAPGPTHAPTSVGAIAPDPVPDTLAQAEVNEPQQVARAQRLLLALGYDVGEVDGALGPATSAAVHELQRMEGLPLTGRLDATTHAALVAGSAHVTAELPARAEVDLSEQELFVYNELGGLVTRWPVSTGGPGNETPTGNFSVLARQRVGTAKDADTVHMDYFTVFDNNIGFHGIPWVATREDRISTPLGQYGVSHGCIRMDDVNAAYLYTFLADGAAVVVRD